MRAPYRILLASAILAAASPFLAGMLAWGYVVQAKQSGLLYLWFFFLPGKLQAYYFPGPVVGVLLSVLVYFLQYAMLLASLSAIVRIATRKLKSSATGWNINTTHLAVSLSVCTVLGGLLCWFSGMAFWLAFCIVAGALAINGVVAEVEDRSAGGILDASKQPEA